MYAEWHASAIRIRFLVVRRESKWFWSIKEKMNSVVRARKSQRDRNWLRFSIELDGKKKIVWTKRRKSNKKICRKAINEWFVVNKTSLSSNVIVDWQWNREKKKKHRAPTFLFGEAWWLMCLFPHVIDNDYDFRQLVDNQIFTKTDDEDCSYFLVQVQEVLFYFLQV